MLPSAVHHMTSPGTASAGQDALFTMTAMPAPDVTYGQYTAAVRQQERTFGQPAPPATEPTGKDGRHRLSPRFSEWMMGLPPGRVTAVPGLSRKDQLHAIGNGVCPQQAAAALADMAPVMLADIGPPGTWELDAA